MQGVNKAVAKVNDLEQIASALAIEKKYDYVICGHIHQPGIQVVENSGGKVVYMNSGDWVENMTALEYVNKSWQLFQYDANNYPSAVQAESNQPLNVITEEFTSLLAKTNLNQ
jgi:UDP-2,3-diacylglucosamine pyrophosphatase LpxH